MIALYLHLLRITKVSDDYYAKVTLMLKLSATH